MLSALQQTDRIGSSAVIHVSNLDAIDFTGIGLLAALSPAVYASSFIDDSLELTGGIETLSFDPRLAVPGIRLLSSPDGCLRQMMLPLGRKLDLASDYWTESVARMPERFPELFREATGLVREGKFVTMAAAFMSVCYRWVGAPVQVVERPHRRVQGNSGPIIRILKEIASKLAPGEMRKFALGGYISDGSLKYHYLHRSLNGGVMLSSERAPSEATVLESVIRDGIEFRGPLDAVYMASGGNTLAHLPFFLDAVAPERGKGPIALEVARSLFRRSGSRLEPNAVSGALLDEYATDLDVKAYIHSLIGEHSWVFETGRWIARLQIPTSERWAWSQAPAHRVIQFVKSRPDWLDFLAPSPLKTLLGLHLRVEALRRASHSSGLEIPVLELREIRGAGAHSLAACSRALRRIGIIESQMRTSDGFTLEHVRRRLASADDVPNSLERAGLLRAMLSRGAELVLRSTILFVDTLGRASIPTLAMVGSRGVLQEFTKEYRTLLLARMSDPLRIRVI